MIIFVLTFLAVIFLIQSLFYIAFDKSYKAGKFSVKSTKESASRVSVIIAAQNEAGNLPVLMEMLLNQDYQDFEVILVNDRSTDHSEEVWNNMELPENFQLLSIESVPEGWNSKKYALHSGIEKSQGELILLTDGDCVPESNHWISAMVSCLQNDDVVLGIGSMKKTRGILGSFIQYENFMTHLQMFGMADLGMPYMAIGRNMLYRKSVFTNEEGFSSIKGITGGDDDLLINQWSEKYRITTCYDPDSRVITMPKKSWKDFFVQKTRHLSVGKYYRLKHKALLGLFIFSKSFFWLTLLILLFTGLEVYLSILLLISMILIFMPVTWERKHVFGSKFKIHFLMFLDFLYVLYYISVSIRIVLVKKVKWT